MIEKVHTMIKREHMLEKRDRIVVGVSGGADSVCLLFMLLELRLQYKLDIIVVHVNHGIRGFEAKQDQDYVERLCKNNHVMFLLVTKNVPTFAQQHNMTIEEAGRIIRYQVFEQAAIQYQANKIAVAHNKNDNAETILFHLIRGSGLSGISGIPPVRGKIIRPLLGVWRNEIECYLKEKEIPFQIDSTNLSEQYTRNKIRHTIIPYLEKEINTNAAEHIVQCGEVIKKTNDFLEKIAKDWIDRYVKKKQNEYEIPISIFSSLHEVIRATIIKKLFIQMTTHFQDLESVHIQMVQNLCQKQSGKQIILPYGLIAVKEFESLRIYKKKEERQLDFSYKISIPGELELKETNQKLLFSIIDYKKNTIIPKKSYTKWFDYDKIEHTILIRNRQSGDYFTIYAPTPGEKDYIGKKKLKDYFINKKIPKEKRDHVPLVADGHHIIWIIGDRISEAYKVTEATKRILVIECKQDK